MPAPTNRSPEQIRDAALAMSLHGIVIDLYMRSNNIIPTPNEPALEIAEEFVAACHEISPTLDPAVHAARVRFDRQFIEGRKFGSILASVGTLLTILNDRFVMLPPTVPEWCAAYFTAAEPDLTGRSGKTAERMLEWLQNEGYFKC